jgi:hypothetical protein
MKTVTMTLNPISVKVEGNTKEEILQNAKREIIKQLEKQFPHFSYSVSEGEVLTMDKARIGTIVEDDKGNIGIITGVNQKTISVIYNDDRHVQGSPQLFKLSAATFEEARSKRPEWMKETNMWSQGNTGYLKNNGEFIPVVIGKSKGNKYKLYTINNDSKFYTIVESQLKSLVDEE